MHATSARIHPASCARGGLAGLSIQHGSSKTSLIFRRSLERTCAPGNGSRTLGIKSPDVEKAGAVDGWNPALNRGLFQRFDKKRDSGRTLDRAVTGSAKEGRLGKAPCDS